MTTDTQSALTIKDAICGAFLGIGTYLAGISWELILVWLIIMFCDVISGTISALKNREFQSSIMREGLINKCLEMFVMLGVIFGIYVIEIVTGQTLAMLNWFLGAFIFKDIMSLVETALHNDIVIPSIVKQWISTKNTMLNDKENEVQE